jgi:hypothetical protein
MTQEPTDKAKDIDARSQEHRSSYTRRRGSFGLRAVMSRPIGAVESGGLAKPSSAAISEDRKNTTFDNDQCRNRADDGIVSASCSGSRLKPHHSNGIWKWLSSTLMGRIGCLSPSPRPWRMDKGR